MSLHAVILIRTQFVPTEDCIKFAAQVEPDLDTSTTHLPEAFVWREGKTTWLYVFYSCQAGGEPYDFRYKRIRTMRRRFTSEDLQQYRRLLSNETCIDGQKLGHSAYLLADGTSLKFNQTPKKVVVKLPSSAPDPIASVVVLEID